MNDELQKLVAAVHKDIKSNHHRYNDAGAWLDKFCTKSAFGKRIEEKLRKFKSAGAPFEREIEIIQFMLEENAHQTLDAFYKMEIDREDTEASVQALALLKAFILAEKKIADHSDSKYIWYDTVDFLTKDFLNAPFLSITDARRILLLTWILTDPDAGADALNLSKFEKMPWEERKKLGMLLFSNQDSAVPNPFRKGKPEIWEKAVLSAYELVLAEKPQTKLTGFCSAAEISSHYHIPLEPLRKKLERFRKKHTLGDDYNESQNRGKNKDTFFYNMAKIEDIISKSSAKRPSKDFS